MSSFLPVSVKSANGHAKKLRYEVERSDRANGETAQIVGIRLDCVEKAYGGADVTDGQQTKHGVQSIQSQNFDDK